MERSKIRKFKDGLCWLLVTEDATNIFNHVRYGMHSNAIDLYALYNDDTMSLIDNVEQLGEAIRLDIDIGMRIGYEPTPNLWSKCKRILNQGHWYVKLSDVVKTI